MSRSLKHWASLKRKVEPSIVAAGFVREGKHFRRDVNDVSWFFEWGRPYDDKGFASILPLVAIGSQAWRDKTGSEMPVGPGSAQFEAELTRLQGDWHAPGFPIDEDRWEASAERIVGMWEEVALPILRSVQTTDDLIAELRRRRWADTPTTKGVTWAIGVWEGKIDPKTTPYKPEPDPLAGKEFTLDEIIAMGKDGA